jgi:mRNA interferase MazF
VKGDVVILPFPFSDLSASKKRPALVIADLDGGDVILCQITSKNVSNSNAIELGISDFSNGSLRQVSNIRPDKIFTACSSLILYKAGSIKSTVLERVIESIIGIHKS